MTVSWSSIQFWIKALECISTYSSRTTQGLGPVPVDSLDWTQWNALWNGPSAWSSLWPETASSHDGFDRTVTGGAFGCYLRGLLSWTLSWVVWQYLPCTVALKYRISMKKNMFSFQETFKCYLKMIHFLCTLRVFKL